MNTPKLLIIKTNASFVSFDDDEGIPYVKAEHAHYQKPIKFLLLLEIINEYRTKKVYLCFFNSKICTVEIYDSDDMWFCYEYI